MGAIPRRRVSSEMAASSALGLSIAAVGAMIGDRMELPGTVENGL